MGDISTNIFYYLLENLKFKFSLNFHLNAWQETYIYAKKNVQELNSLRQLQ